VSAASEAVAEMKVDRARFDLDALFRAEYARVARIIARVVRDAAGAEELAVEVFLKLARNENAQNGNTEGWLYRAAVRVGLDELRRQTRRTRYEFLAALVRTVPTPEEIHVATEEQARVRLVLRLLAPRRVELLLLRSDGLSYNELAAALDLNPASVGTLLSRAQQEFRKEYLKRYGNQ
jgi:RNA polymerase sigma-70 factor (ECF subfamily)